MPLNISVVDQTVVRPPDRRRKRSTEPGATDDTPAAGMLSYLQQTSGAAKSPGLSSETGMAVLFLLGDRRGTGSFDA